MVMNLDYAYAVLYMYIYKKRLEWIGHIWAAMTQSV